MENSVEWTYTVLVHSFTVYSCWWSMLYTSCSFHQCYNFTSDILLYLPNNCLVLTMPSDYIDLGWWIHPCKMFVKLSGISPTKIQALFFDGYDFHWDANVLNYLSNNNVCAFFLSSQMTVRMISRSRIISRMTMVLIY